MRRADESMYQRTEKLMSISTLSSSFALFSYYSRSACYPFTVPAQASIVAVYEQRRFGQLVVFIHRIVQGPLVSLSYFHRWQQGELGIVLVM